MSDSGSRTYHHGDLPAALRAAAAEVVQERGPAGISIREIARRAGVSHSAPGHHFDGANGILVSVAGEGYQRLADALRSELVEADDPATGFRQVCRAYVQTAQDLPGHFGIMLQQQFIDRHDQRCLDEGLRIFGYFRRAVSRLGGNGLGPLDLDATTLVVWSSLHGLAALSGCLDELGTVSGSTSCVLQMADELASAVIDECAGAGGRDGFRPGPSSAAG